MAGELGINLTKEDNEKLKGVSRTKSLEIILELGRKKLPERKRDELADRKNTWFLEYVEAMKPTDIFPGVKKLIVEMRKRSLKVALASSSKNARRVVELLGIDELFDAMVDGTMIIHSKPNPEIFLLAAERLGIDPKESVVFEDAEAGVEAALAAGMKCIGVGSPAQLGKADVVVARTGDFDLSLLARL